MKGYVETNNPLHQAWIDEHVGEKCRQQCLDKADRMANVFSELRVVGQASIMSGHAWCVDENDRVVDPTAHQFTDRYPYSTVRLEREDFPIRKCPQCGDTQWPNTSGVRKYLKEHGDEYYDHAFCEEQFRQKMERIERR